MRLLFAAAEIFPYAKSGGLADIAHALTKELAESVDVTAVMPLYASIDKKLHSIRPTGKRFSFKIADASYDVELFKGNDGLRETIFIYNPTLCDRKGLYGPPGGAYEDNDVRFMIFCKAIVEIARSYSFDILHLNDWHTAMAALLARKSALRCKIVFTIHNLAYQGLFPKESLERTGVSKKHFNMEELEFYGQVNWMKGAIAHADAVTTVSPSYAVEIQEAEFGCGLDGFLRKHSRKLVGILNGIDTNIYDPSRDPALAANYSHNDLKGKEVCKKALLDEIDIKKYEQPLFIFIGRFVEQKGVGLIAEAMEEMAKRPMTVAILGEGEKSLESELEKCAEKYPDVSLRLGYDEELSHRMYAAADFLLMPSRFEPCGLNQMIAMRYGTVPIVHSVGGLRDTVHPINFKNCMCGAGFVFERFERSHFLKAVEDALELYSKRGRLKRVGVFDMKCDFSIKKCAKSYLELYGRLL